MPTIAQFYGIAIRMYYREHGVPHFHAEFGGYNAVYSIEDIEILEGELPRRARNLIREWATQHQVELLEMWETRNYRKIGGLE